MDLRIISLETPQENIFFDDVLLAQAEDGISGEVLRFWESAKPFIVLGRTSKEARELIASSVEHDQIPVIRRSSGGGVVVQGKGCLNFSLVLSKKDRPQLKTIASSYEFILEKIVSALKTLKIDTQFLPPCDLALKSNHRKFSGNAQKRGKDFILHHGTILYNFDIGLAERYLAMPLKEPVYRNNRAHRDFMANIEASAKDLIRAISRVFSASGHADQITDVERARLEKFLKK